jgi:3-hydroxy-3-methylglutaryl CoA synthase
MAGIISYGAYIPIYRLSRDIIAQGWGSRSQGGERSVANYDEDSLTMAVEAAFDGLQGLDHTQVDGLFYASTTSPYKEKQCAVLAAAVLDLPQEIVTADFTNSLRAGTSALRSALDAVRGGSAKRVLVTCADSRLGYPHSEQEQAFGDGAAALLIGEGESVEVEDSLSIANEIADVWRTDEDTFVRTWEDRWVLTHGYTETMQRAVSALMKKKGLGPQDFAKVVLSAPDARSHTALAQSLGFDAKTQLQDSFLSQVGSIGAAHPLLMLAAALEEAKVGDRILFAAYGDGSDVFLFRVKKKVPGKGRRGVKGYLASQRPLPSYEKYLSYRGLLSWPEREPLRLFPSATAMWRSRASVLGLRGSRCRQCSLVSFPIQRVCYGCQARDDYDEVTLSRERGRLFTYSLDNLAGGVDPPIVQSIVELEGGARVYCLMTDNDPSQVAVDMPLEMTFRRFYEGAGFHNYFWKCRPLR